MLLITKSLCLEGEGNGFEAVPPRSVQIEKRKLSGILASSHYKVTTILLSIYSFYAAF